MQGSETDPRDPYFYGTHMLGRGFVYFFFHYNVKLTITLPHVSMDLQVVDIFTKALPQGFGINSGNFLLVDSQQKIESVFGGVGGNYWDFDQNPKIFIQCSLSFNLHQL